MLEHIEKLVTATAEVSFLSGSETLAMLVSERLYSVQQKVLRKALYCILYVLNAIPFFDPYFHCACPDPE